MSRAARGAGALLAALLLLAPGVSPAQQGSGPAILVVSRTAVLEETQAAKRLSQAEVAATSDLQREIDEAKAELAAEEEELARLRGTLEREIFDARVENFDRKVREVRRKAQSQAAELQLAYRNARRKLVDALDPVLERVRQETGALAILNAESVLVSDPSLDVTERVIEIFDQTVEVPVVKVSPVPELLGGGKAAPDRAPEGAGGD